MAEENNNNEENIKVPNVDLTGPEGYKGIFDIDKTLGLGAAAIQAKSVDNKAIEEYISGIETPASGGALDKVAALYRSRGEGAVLRAQRNVRNLIGPTVNLLKERQAAFEARFAVLQESLPDISNSVIFGDEEGNPIPITDDIISRSDQVRQDMRQLAALNPADERYRDLQKKIEKNQDVIVQFDLVNKQLLEIRNGQEVAREDWSQSMTDEEIAMWDDIYNENGANIKINEEGRLVWQDPNNPETPPVYLDKLTKSPKVKNTQAQTIDYNIRGRALDFKNKYGDNASITSEAYNVEIQPLFFQMRQLKPEGISSLIFNGIGADNLYTGINTDDFVRQVIENQIINNPEFNQKYGGEDGIIDTDTLNTDEMAVIINDMKRKGALHKYYNANGEQETLETQFLNWYKSTVDEIITGTPAVDVSRTQNTRLNIRENNQNQNQNQNQNKNKRKENRDYGDGGFSFNIGVTDTGQEFIMAQGTKRSDYNEYGSYIGDDPDIMAIGATASTGAGVESDNDIIKSFSFITSVDDLSANNLLSAFSRDTTINILKDISYKQLLIDDGVYVEEKVGDETFEELTNIDYAFRKGDDQIVFTKDGKNWQVSSINKDNSAYNKMLLHMLEKGQIKENIVYGTDAGDYKDGLLRRNNSEDVLASSKELIPTEEEKTSVLEKQQVGPVAEEFVKVNLDTTLFTFSNPDINGTFVGYDESKGRTYDHTLSTSQIKDADDWQDKQIIQVGEQNVAFWPGLGVNNEREFDPFKNLELWPSIKYKDGLALPVITTEINVEGYEGYSTFKNATMEFVNGVMVLKYDPNDKKTWFATDSVTEMTNVFKQFYQEELEAEANKIQDRYGRQEISYNQQRKLLEELQDKFDKKMANIADTMVKQSVRHFNEFYEAKEIRYVQEAYNTPNKDFEYDLKKLTSGGIQFKDDPKDRFIPIGEILFDNGDETFVTNSLNRQYSQYGFTFKELSFANADERGMATTGLGKLQQGFLKLEKDYVIVTHPNFDYPVYIRIDQDDDKDNYAQADLLKMIMRAMYNGNRQLVADLAGIDTALLESTDLGGDEMITLNTSISPIDQGPFSRSVVTDGSRFFTKERALSKKIPGSLYNLQKSQFNITFP